MFFGRKYELLLLNRLFEMDKASIVVCKGRRRIGKSTLIEHFGKTVKNYYEFQGLSPRENISNTDQLKSFGEQLAAQTSLPQMRFDSWFQAFSLLAEVLPKKKCVVFLDEISWMGGKDKDFAGQLKIIWDTKLKHSSNFLLVLCGSVSSWIDKNILNSTGFMGRVSLELFPDELSLPDCNRFWKNKTGRIAVKEKLKLLAVTGGVPRYLEEININLSAEENIKSMCFSQEGLLFNEFDRIFTDIFSHRAGIYKKIIATLVNGNKSVSEISKAIGRERSGALSEYLNDLSSAGFIMKNNVYKPGSRTKSRLFKYRLKDNYLRFYLKYIEPEKSNILIGIHNEKSLESFIEWDIIMGLQFENLVLNNINAICRQLSIPENSTLTASSYFQKNNHRQEACQIDLLIQTKHTIYVCEIKFRSRIDKTVISEVTEKIRKLKQINSYSIRPVLIYHGNLSSCVREEDYFDKIICFDDLLNSNHL